MWIQIVTIVLLFSVTLIAKPGDLDFSFGGGGWYSYYGGGKC